jgi:hypothetical protein
MPAGVMRHVGCCSRATPLRCAVVRTAGMNPITRRDATPPESYLDGAIRAPGTETRLASPELRGTPVACPLNRAEPAMTQTVLVTGAAGFVDSHPVDPLIAAHTHVQPRSAHHQPGIARFRRAPSGGPQPAARCR